MIKILLSLYPINKKGERIPGIMGSKEKELPYLPSIGMKFNLLFPDDTVSTLGYNAKVVEVIYNELTEQYIVDLETDSTTVDFITRGKDWKRITIPNL